MNIGEEICGEYLRHVRHCEFVQYNLKPPDIQAEIDVIGINLAENTVYVCEVAIHLITGLQYVKNKRPDNVLRLTTKFQKDIKYINNAFPKPKYKHVFMFWSPVVRNQRSGSHHNQLQDVENIIGDMKRKSGVTVEIVINQKFKDKLVELRNAVGGQSKELDSSVSRFMQVEAQLEKHLKRLKNAQHREG
jgi:hypothetical protein